MRVSFIVALAASVAAAGFAVARASAACAFDSLISLTPNGPQPPVVAVDPGAFVGWSSGAGATSRVVFTGSRCRALLEPPPGVVELSGCAFGTPGVYSYTVDGYGAGTGQVVVRGTPPTSQRRTVVYGSVAQLGGVFMLARACGPPVLPAGTPLESSVTVTARPFGSSAFSPLTTLIARDGAWSYGARPGIETTYVVEGPLEPSAPIAVSVRPRLTLERAGANVLLARAAAARPLADARVELQRRTRAGRWVIARRLTLDARSAARIRVGVAETTIVRLHMTRAQAGPGFVEGFSAPVVLR